MNTLDVDTVLRRAWPAELRTGRLLLRPVGPADGHLVRELLTDGRVRAFLGGPASPERIAARQTAYPKTPGAWAVVRADDQGPVGLVTIGADHRREGRAEVSYQLLPSAWGQGLGREAVAAAVGWWTGAVPGAGPLVAVTQEANTASRRLLEAIGFVLVAEFEEHGARQCLYGTGRTDSPAGVNPRWEN
ncbi:GNAT family N-acetyltransferase [Streptomyces roseolus]|uniref:GNAT family N-acetyltransferase n=1 Tax=Streptomyces roseolus TaxID=67358 RepID=UPI00378FDDC3